MKIIALGAWGPNSYFSDGWNTFDFCVVVLCYINYIPNSGNATALRALRALRPLRSFGLVPQLRKTFNGILNVLRNTARVEIVDWFLMFVVTLVAVQLWAGQMSGGCFYKDPNFDASDYAPPSVTRLNIASNVYGVQANTAYSAIPGFVRTRLINNLFYNADSGFGLCALDAHGPAFKGTNLPTLAGFAPAPPACPPVTVDKCPPVGGATVGAYNVFGACTAPLIQVVEQQQCLPYQNPMSWGAPQLGMSYDNVGIGFLTTFMAESEEGWTSVVYTLWNTFGANWFVALFFVALVLIVDDFVSVMTGTFEEPACRQRPALALTRAPLRRFAPAPPPRRRQHVDGLQRVHARPGRRDGAQQPRGERAHQPRAREDRAGRDVGREPEPRPGRARARVHHLVARGGRDLLQRARRALQPLPGAAGAHEGMLRPHREALAL